MTVDERQRQSARPLSPGEAGAAPLIAPGVTFKSVTNQIATIVLRPDVPVFWFAVFAVAIAALCVLVAAIAILLGWLERHT
jgi:molybdopterin-containing oxidoreductase family membrane subunit